MSAKPKKPDLSKLQEQYEQAKLDGNKKLMQFYKAMIEKLRGNK